MKRNNSWKWALVAFLVAWSIYQFYPPAPRDLIAQFKSDATVAAQTDTNFTAIVQRAQDLRKKNSTRDFGNLLEAIGTNDIRPYFSDFDTKAEQNPTRTILNRVQHNAAGKINLGIDLQGGTSFLVGMDTNNLEKSSDRERILSQALEVLRKRVDKFGVAEPIIQPAGADRILIQLPGLSEDQKETYRHQIETAAFLEFRLVHENSEELIKQGIIEPGYEVLQQKTKNPDGTFALQQYLVQKRSAKG
ncbi:MAG: hypothetical protein ABJC04_02805, partial [Verrucomicrobiota bacterium]